MGGVVGTPFRIMTREIHRLRSSPPSARHPRRPDTVAREGFTIVELLVVIAVVALLAGMLIPTLSKAREAAQRTQCLNQLHQLFLASQLYWDDHEGRTFRYRQGAVGDGVLYWFGWLQNGAEGMRTFDGAQGALGPYLKGSPVQLCPAFASRGAHVKLKASTLSYGYGMNLHLSPAPAASLKIDSITEPARIVWLADAAQINTFQQPASESDPRLEEFYYVNATETTAHFRHRGQAEAVFVDGHASAQQAAPGTWDTRLPRERVGRLEERSLIP